MEEQEETEQQPTNEFEPQQVSCPKCLLLRVQLIAVQRLNQRINLKNICLNCGCYFENDVLTGTSNQEVVSKSTRGYLG